MPLTPHGWTLLKIGEGCRLSAYPDPASGGAPWTVGYGHAGQEVVPGQTITQVQAEAWLQMDAAEASSAVDRLLRALWKDSSGDGRLRWLMQGLPLQRLWRPQ